MKSRRFIAIAGAAVFIAAPSLRALATETVARAVIPAEREEALKVPMPADFHVEFSELDGPVFADARGRTLYTWPLTTMRNGITGDPANQSACNNEKQTHTAGLMSPYPPGLELPELNKRQSCTDAWIPTVASDTSKSVGDFTVITRKDGTKQWAYDGHALYTSYLDRVPGDVMGATTRDRAGRGPAARHVATAPTFLPPGFAVVSTEQGRQLVTDKHYSVYMSARDGASKSHCDDTCARTWVPVVASVAAQAKGDWSIFERAPGVRQWAFRKRPLYTFAEDQTIHSQEGSDIPGWTNVYTQKAPAPPRDFTFQDTMGGIVLADAKGRTIYTYNCADDSVDQLACDQVDSPQAYRLSICGGGQVERCLRDWPYVFASDNAVSISRTWQVLTINPQTGNLAQQGDAGAVRVWAYLGVPVYTNSHDKAPGDMYGHGNGEFLGNRNGFRAFVVRAEYLR